MTSVFDIQYTMIASRIFRIIKVLQEYTIEKSIIVQYDNYKSAIQLAFEFFRFFYGSSNLTAEEDAEVLANVLEVVDKYKTVVDDRCENLLKYMDVGVSNEHKYYSERLGVLLGVGNIECKKKRAECLRHMGRIYDDIKGVPDQAFIYYQQASCKEDGQITCFICSHSKIIK